MELIHTHTHTRTNDDTHRKHNYMCGQFQHRYFGVCVCMGNK